MPDAMLPPHVYYSLVILKQLEKEMIIILILQSGHVKPREVG